jgi:hypothetical protein
MPTGQRRNSMPDTPVDIDYDFLIENDKDPVTFYVKTLGKTKTLFQKEIDIKPVK